MYSSSARRPAAIRTTYKNRLDLGNNRGIRNVPANAVFGMKSASHERCVRSAAIVTRLAERDWSIARGVSGRFVARHSGNWATTHTPQLTCHGDDRYPSGGTAGNRSIYMSCISPVELQYWKKKIYVAAAILVVSLNISPYMHQHP